MFCRCGSSGTLAKVVNESNCILFERNSSATGGHQNHMLVLVRLTEVLKNYFVLFQIFGRWVLPEEVFAIITCSHDVLLEKNKERIVL